MATVESPDIRNRIVEERTTTEVAAGGSSFTALAGVATVVLTIVGLANVVPVYLAAIAAIVLGAGLVCQGAASAGRFARSVEDSSGVQATDADVGGGMMAEFLGGVAGIILGVLALVLSVSWTLLAVVAIVFGAAFVVSAASALNVRTSPGGFGANEASRRLTAMGTSAAAGIQAAIGLAGIVLGIIALAHNYIGALTLVALLVLGCSAILSGAAFSSKMFTSMRRSWGR